MLGLSTRTRSVWTFDSAGTGAQQVLPLLDVDYPAITRSGSATPALDLENTGRLRDEVTLHLKATHQRGSVAGEIDTMAVWVSYDDGVTWTAAPTRVHGDGEFTADYRHPHQGEFVSLKVRVGDRDGNTLEQSLVRAYRLGGR